jgi:hypothetical protein
MSSSVRGLAARRLVASAASLSVAVCAAREAILCPPACEISREDVALIAVSASPLVLAAVLIWSRRLGPALFVRGCWWSHLVLGVVAAGRLWREAGAQAALPIVGSALALLAVGSAGLEEARGRFRPAAFRWTLLITLALAMANLSALTVFVGQYVVVGWLARSFSAGPWAVLTALGVVGLVRLRLWGLLVTIGCNLAVGALVATSTLATPDHRGLFVGTAILQVVVASPLAMALARRRVAPFDRWDRALPVAALAAIVVLTAVGTYEALWRRTPSVLFGGIDW